MCLIFLAAYGVGPRTIRLLWIYCIRLTMVARAGGYFGRPFKGYRGIIQGDPLSPKIFNVIVDAVIRHWVVVVVVVVPTEYGTEGLFLSIQDLVAYFYVDDGLVPSTQLERLQGRSTSSPASSNGSASGRTRGRR